MHTLSSCTVLLRYINNTTIDIETTMSVSQLFDKGRRPNVLLIITDQERSLQHWPRSFYEENCPNMCRLLKHGLEFTNYYTNSCMCSPSRATLLTSQFPQQTGVTMTSSPEPRTILPSPTEVTNMATVFQRAGYHVEWHGKWHLGGNPSEYGFQGWQPPDAGNYLTVNETLGGGEPDNDTRFLNEICSFLEGHCQQQNEADADADANADAKDIKPFLLVASFVNPHDVYVAQHEPSLGYTEDDFEKVKVPLPSNWQEDPNENNKPRAQGRMSIPYVTFENDPQDYVNFYAYLHTVVDAQIGKVLDAFDKLQLTDNTLILRTSDHGEQALSHSLVEKFYNCYEESIHIPFIVSNPIAFPNPLQTAALASHVDIVPTLQRLLTIGSTTPPTTTSSKESSRNKDEFVGQDLTPILDTMADSPSPLPEVQSNIHFTYDDIPCSRCPSVVRCIRTKRFKYAVYFTPDGKDADWELYDLVKDPLENDNIAGRPSFATLQESLDRQLVQTMTKLKTYPTEFAWPPIATKQSRGVD
jgi:choline-sulfatase